MTSIAVVAGMICKNQKILIAKRSDEPKLWEFPGGKVEKGETLEEALIRELQEELDCTVEITDYIAQSNIQAGGKQIKMDLFACRIIKGEPQPLEHDALLWIEKKELNDWRWAAADIPLLADVEMFLSNKGL